MKEGARIPTARNGKRDFPLCLIYLIQKESFKGILVRFMKKKLDNDILNKFKQMNDKLKEVAEKEYH